MGIELIIFFIILGVLLVIGVIYFIAKSKGKITIDLEKLEYSPGETIKGKIVLNLKKSVEASTLNVGLIGVKKTRSYSSKGASSRSETVFDFKKPVDNSGKFVIGEKSYDFELKVPGDVLQKGNAVVDSLVRTIGALTGGSSSVTWYVVSNLEMKGFDLSSKVRINLG